MSYSDYIGRYIRVQSYKHDGSLHRAWDNAMVVEANDDYIVVVSKCNKVIESDGRRWFTREPAVSVFFFKKWYNFIAMFKENNAIMYYCNIASPSIIDNDYIKYIDYDLDLKLLPNKSVIQLDAKEYEYHRKKYGYSEDLNFVCRNANDEVKELMKQGLFPFKDSLMEEYYKRYQEFLKDQEETIIDK